MILRWLPLNIEVWRCFIHVVTTYHYAIDEPLLLLPFHCFHHMSRRLFSPLAITLIICRFVIFFFRYWCRHMAFAIAATTLRYCHIRVGCWYWSCGSSVFFDAFILYIRRYVYYWYCYCCHYAAIVTLRRCQLMITPPLSIDAAIRYCLRHAIHYAERCWYATYAILFHTLRWCCHMSPRLHIRHRLLLHMLALPPLLLYHHMPFRRYATTACHWYDADATLIVTPFTPHT